MAFIDITSSQQLKDQTACHTTVVVHFSAPWCEPCRQLDLILAELGKQYELGLLRVEAEEVPDVSEEYGVSVVPLFVFFKGGKQVDRLEGADIAALNAKVEQHSTARPSAAPSGTQRLEQLISSQPVMLFIKGTPETPRCGFSSRVVAILRQLGIPFGSFDILSDSAVRQGLKDYSKWPTYPQLYVRGEFLGGCDIVTDMHEDGSLQEELLGATTSGTNGSVAANGTAHNCLGSQSLDERLGALVREQPVMLFMKGNPDAPQCGFSAKVVSILRQLGIPFGSFDILKDDDVREGLKKYSDWPTFPQLYAGGELLGGCDIVKEMHAAGELKDELKKAGDGQLA